MRHFLARAADWIKVKQLKDSIVEKHVEPPMSIVRDILATPDMPLDVLTHIVNTPIFAANGTLQSEPGYQTESKTYFVPTIGLKIPAVADKPSGDDVRTAVSLITDDLLIDFPFCGAPERGHSLALFLRFINSISERLGVRRVT